MSANKKKAAFFRTDANTEIGMGHLIRCIALAQMLTEHFDIHFIFKTTPAALVKQFLPTGYKSVQLPETAPSIEEPSFIEALLSASDILTLDGYQFDSTYQKDCAKRGFKVAYIDDLLKFSYSCDVLINQADFITPSDYTIEKETVFCLGPSFALLRPSFLKAASLPCGAPKKIENVFVCFGGADTENTTYKVIKALIGLKQVKIIHVLAGSVNKNFSKWQREFSDDNNIQYYTNLDEQSVCSLMSTCQLALCPSSSLSLELCAVGVPMITGITAPNQSNYYKSLLHHGVAFGIGDWNKASHEQIAEAVLQTLNLPGDELNKILIRQRRLIDGRSAERLQKVYFNLASEAA